MVKPESIVSLLRDTSKDVIPLITQLQLEDNGVPIHLKGGARDAVLYRTTMGLTIAGTVYVVYELVKAALPKKKE